MEQSNGISISLPSLNDLPEGMEITIRRGVTGGTQTATIPVAAPVNQQAQFVPPVTPPPVHSPPWKFPKLDFTTLSANAAKVGGKAKEWGKQYGWQVAITGAVVGGIVYPEAIAQGFNTIAPLFGKTSEPLPTGGAIYPNLNPPPAEQATQPPPTEGNLPPVPEVESLPIEQGASAQVGNLPTVVVPKPEGEEEQSNFSKLKDFVFNRQKQQVESPKFFFPLANASSQENSVLTSTVGGIRPLGCNPSIETCREHQGADWVTKTGTMVAIASIDGKVTELQFHNGVGGIIAITGELNGEEIEFRYVHLDHEMLRRLKVGQEVKAGEVLSTITKRWAGSSGAHLHFEAWLRSNGNRVLHRAPEILVKDAKMFELKR